ncbi:MAG: hypothetical protein SOV95_00585 [Anaerovibrio sp.]|uniref:hypothetical protein n=1 Tax=Anaerovibrio sp. TaxID=1872532 RepID=UPI0026075D78|nr:hypothetical protein [Anaerovibrio sp.]MDD7677313.1 hypothetical protein [Anaerovibrio sp.]MDY2602766.1 hypothetical protein [Anaerovibrio sp.]
MLYSKLFKKDKTLEFHVIKEYEDRDGGDNLIVRVELEEKPDAFCEWRLPDIFCYKSYGFSEDDTIKIKNYIRNNEMLMWSDYRKEMKNKNA